MAVWKLVDGGETLEEYQMEVTKLQEPKLMSLAMQGTEHPKIKTVQEKLVRGYCYLSERTNRTIELFSSSQPLFFMHCEIFKIISLPFTPECKNFRTEDVNTLLLLC